MSRAPQRVLVLGCGSVAQAVKAALVAEVRQNAWPLVGEGALRPTLIQRAGKPAMETAALLRGRAIAPGTVLVSGA